MLLFCQVLNVKLKKRWDTVYQMVGYSLSNGGIQSIIWGGHSAIQLLRVWGNLKVAPLYKKKE